MKRTVLLGVFFAVSSVPVFGLSGYSFEEIKQIKDRLKEENQRKITEEESRIQDEQRAEGAIPDQPHPYPIDEQVVDVKEPASHEELMEIVTTPRDEVVGAPLPGVPVMWEGNTPGDLRRTYERWSLKKDDFVPMTPVEDRIRLKLGDDLGYFIIPYRVTNSTDQQVVLVPRIWILNDSGRVDVEVGGFLAKRNVSASMVREVYSTQEILASLSHETTGMEPLGVIESGKARWGAAIFPTLDREMDTMQVVVEGLSNDYNFARMYRPVLVMSYERKGDEFYPQFDVMDYHGKRWERQWMWWMETTVGRPDKAEVTGPAEVEEKTQRTVWVFDLTLKNSMDEDQKITLKEVSMLFKVEGVTLSDADEGLALEVRIPDDGESTIYKAKALEQTARDYKPHRFVYEELEKESQITMTVAVDTNDIDWEAIYDQVWYQRKPPVAAMYEAAVVGAAKRSEPLDYFLARGLSEEQKKRVRDQVLEKLPAVCEDMMNKRLVRLELSARAGISTGSFEVLRDFTRRTPLDQNLRVKWRDVD